MGKVISNKKFDYVAILKNERKYKDTKIKLIKLVCKKYGQQVFSDYSLPKDFDYDTLNAEYFDKTYTQNMSIPLSTNQFKMLTTLPKKAINIPFVFNSKDKHIIGQYLLGSINNKPVLFALSIVQDAKNPTEEFNIKLDACINGKDWIQLTRLDSSGAPHPNFYDENSFALNTEELTYVPAPHIHYCIQRSQILNGNKFDYMPAKHIQRELLLADNKTMLENGLKYFLDYVGIQEELDYTAITGKSYNSYLFKDYNADDRFVYSNDDAQNFINTYFNQKDFINDKI